jgi:hypothetical protein
MALLTVSLEGEISEVISFSAEALMPNPSSVEVVYADGSSIGSMSGFSAAPELQIDLAGKRTTGVDNCDGDTIWYCSPPDNLDERTAEFKTQLAALSGGVFTDAAGVDELRQHIRVPPNVRVPIPKQLPIDCHSEGNRGECGNGFLLGTSQYWAVKTAEVQGDFLHDLYHLYDSNTKLYFLPTSPQSRSLAPRELSDWEPSDVSVSADGRWLLESNRLIELDGTAKAISLEGACGWLSQ